MESVAFNVDELPNLKRKDLQSLAKRLGIKANQSNAAIIESLRAWQETQQQKNSTTTTKTSVSVSAEKQFEESVASTEGISGGSPPDQVLTSSSIAELVSEIPEPIAAVPSEEFKEPILPTQQPEAEEPRVQTTKSSQQSSNRRLPRVARPTAPVPSGPAAPQHEQEASSDMKSDAVPVACLEAVAVEIVAEDKAASVEPPAALMSVDRKKAVEERRKTARAEQLKAWKARRSEARMPPARAPAVRHSLSTASARARIAVLATPKTRPAAAAVPRSAVLQRTQQQQSLALPKLRMPNFDRLHAKLEAKKEGLDAYASRRLQQAQAAPATARKSAPGQHRVQFDKEAAQVDGQASNPTATPLHKRRRASNNPATPFQPPQPQNGDALLEATQQQQQQTVDEGEPKAKRQKVAAPLPPATTFRVPQPLARRDPKPPAAATKVKKQPVPHIHTPVPAPKPPTTASAPAVREFKLPSAPAPAPAQAATKLDLQKKNLQKPIASKAHSGPLREVTNAVVNNKLGRPSGSSGAIKRPAPAAAKADDAQPSATKVSSTVPRSISTTRTITTTTTTTVTRTSALRSSDPRR